MKKREFPANDEPRPEYVRSDFGEMVRGKYAALLKVPSRPPPAPKKTPRRTQ